MNNAAAKAKSSANALVNSISEKKKDYTKAISDVVDSSGIRNPFVRSDGAVVNKYIDYQQVLNNPSVSTAAKQLITQATGLKPASGTETIFEQNMVENTKKSPSQQISTTGDSLVDTAKKYLGTKYVWGGASPQGFDCSGLMQYVFKENGIDISRTSQEQFKNGTAVSKNELQPGDLVFFAGYTKDMSNPGHVGMYIGGGQYIQAPKTGDVVKISNLSGRSDYAGARRISGNK